MRVLLDTNVLLDVLLKRDPWVTEASAVWQAHDEGQVFGHVMACAIADIFYIARRLVGLETAQVAVRICLEAFEICAVDRQALEQAQALLVDDFEDNLQIACASLAGLDAIVPRDKKGFKAVTMPVLTPAELVTQLGRAERPSDVGRTHFGEQDH
jgi:predicted nucleic acid-binding protein